MATGRIGVTPTLGTRWSKAPAGGTTSLSGLDDNSVSLVYSVGYEQVYRNGVLLSRGNDYTATTGNSITLIDATIAGDIIEVFANQLVPLTDAISKGQFTAKGALLSATAASTPAVLTVGSNDQVLTADSSTATGLKWANLSTPTSQLKPKDVGRYLMNNAAATVSSFTATEDVTVYIPIFLPAYSFDRIQIRTHSTFAGTATVRLGLYNADGTTYLPSTVVFDAGTVSATASSTNYDITISQTLSSAGWYYFAFNMQTAGTTNIFNGVSSANNENKKYGSVLDLNSNPITSYTQSGVTGAFATATSLTNGVAAIIPFVGLRIA